MIVERAASIMGVLVEAEGALEIARRSRGTPRIANRLLRRVRDFAEVRGDGVIARGVAESALQMLNVDAAGFDSMDRLLLMAIIDNFNGGPVGLDTLAVAISEDAGTLEDVVEPYLIQQGFIMRTPRGRVATPKAYQHLGLKHRERGGVVESGVPAADLFQ